MRRRRRDVIVGRCESGLGWNCVDTGSSSVSAASFHTAVKDWNIGCINVAFGSVWVSEGMLLGKTILLTVIDALGHGMV